MSLAIHTPHQGDILVIAKPVVISWTGVDPSLHVALCLVDERRDEIVELVSGIRFASCWTWEPAVAGPRFRLKLETSNGGPEHLGCYSGQFSIITELEGEKENKKNN